MSNYFHAFSTFLQDHFSALSLKGKRYKRTFILKSHFCLVQFEFHSMHPVFSAQLLHSHSGLNAGVQLNYFVTNGSFSLLVVDGYLCFLAHVCPSSPCTPIEIQLFLSYCYLMFVCNYL